MSVVSFIVVCNPSCVQGACVSTDTCNCPYGYEGDHCENTSECKCTLIIYNGRCSFIWLW